MTDSSTQTAPAKKFQFVGGDLCLDFCNTMGGKRSGIPREYLNTIADFVSWCEQAGLIGLPEAKALLRQAALDHLLGPIARSAANLLTRDELLYHVSHCGGDNCGWLFVDSSKNHSRRWCDMRDCGNRAKVRRHRLKQAK